MIAKAKMRWSLWKKFENINTVMTIMILIAIVMNWNILYGKNNINCRWFLCLFFKKYSTAVCICYFTKKEYVSFHFISFRGWVSYFKIIDFQLLVQNKLFSSFICHFFYNGLQNSLFIIKYNEFVLKIN